MSVQARVMIFGFFFAGMLLYSCSPSATEKSTEKGKNLEAPVVHRLVSANGAISEIVALAGLEHQLVGVDVTSNFPPSLRKLPKIGHNRNIEAEGVLSLGPTLILANAGDLKPEVEEQLKQSKATIQLFPQREYSLAGTETLILEVTKLLEVAEKGQELVAKIHQDLEGIQHFSIPPKVLFIYARGAGSLMVAGENTQIESIIEMAGGQNAVGGFESFKPLTTEALLTADPDVVLMFNSGAESLDGKDGIQQIPGLAQTKAGKNKAFITMEGSFLSNFGPRLGEAVKQLNAELLAHTQPI